MKHHCLDAIIGRFCIYLFSGGKGYMQRKFDLQEFKNLFCFNTNSYVSQKLGISIYAVKRRAYCHGIKKDPAFLKKIRSEIGRVGGGRRWRNEKDV